MASPRGLEVGTAVEVGWYSWTAGRLLRGRVVKRKGGGWYGIAVPIHDLIPRVVLENRGEFGRDLGEFTVGARRRELWPLPENADE